MLKEDKNQKINNRPDKPNLTEGDYKLFAMTAMQKNCTEWEHVEEKLNLDPPVEVQSSSSLSDISDQGILRRKSSKISNSEEVQVYVTDEEVGNFLTVLMNEAQDWETLRLQAENALKGESDAKAKKVKKMIDILKDHYGHAEGFEKAKNDLKCESNNCRWSECMEALYNAANGSYFIGFGEDDIYSRRRLHSFTKSAEIQSRRMTVSEVDSRARLALGDAFETSHVLGGCAFVVSFIAYKISNKKNKQDS